MRAILGLAIATVVTIGSARAAEDFRIGRWDGKAYSERNGVVTQCLARMDQALGVQINLALGRDGLLTLTVFHPQWNFATGRDIAANVGVDDKKAEPFTARVLDRGRLRVRFEDVAPIEATLRSGRVLNVRAAGAVAAAYRLEQIGEVLDRLRSCIAVTGDVLPVAAPPPEDKSPNPYLKRPGQRGEESEMPLPRRATGAMPMPTDDWPAIQKRAAPMPGIYRQGSILAPQELYKLAAPSVYLVLVDAGGVDTWTSLGSAVAITPDTLLTNCHVIHNARRIELRQGEWRASPTILAGDPRTDRCFLRVAEGGLKPVRGARPSTDLQVGEPAYSLGNPSGFDQTFGEGIVSAIRGMRRLSYVQTSAPVSPGSSGGALFDARGNLIGITTLMAWDPTKTHVFHFAIAADEYWR
jgi:hypothetical protein